jgi:hypothetical protein
MVKLVSLAAPSTLVGHGRELAAVGRDRARRGPSDDTLPVPLSGLPRRIPDALARSWARSHLLNLPLPLYVSVY